MSREWLRITQTNQNNSGFFGSLEMTTVVPGDTVLRSYWNIGLIGTWVDPGQYPPGGSILRVGLGYFESGLDPLDTPTPITNGLADWLDIETIHPRAEFTSAVDLIYMLHWDFPKDESVKSQRKNGTAGDMALYVCWEFNLHDEISGFTIPWWTASVDAYINTP